MNSASTVMASSLSSSSSSSAEKDFLKNHHLPISHPAATPIESARRRRKVIMTRIGHVCFLLFALALLATTLVHAGPAAGRRPTELSDAEKFRQLLETIDPTTLHDILHEHLKDKYQHGVWPEDKVAMEALHKEDAEGAQNLVHLAKRQASGGNANGTTVVTTTAVTEITTDVTVTISSTPTPQDPTTTPPTSPTPISPTTTSSSPTPTPTPPSSPTTTTTTSTLPPSSTTTTPSSSLSSTLSSSTTTASSSLSSSTSSTITSSSRTTRTTRPSQEVTTEIVYTTTLADGAASVVTRVTVVPADQATQGPQSTRTGANASLQTPNAAVKLHHGWTAGLGVVGAALVWAL